MASKYCEFVERLDPDGTRRLVCPRCKHVTRPTQLPIERVQKVCTPPFWKLVDGFDEEYAHGTH